MIRVLAVLSFVVAVVLALIAGWNVRDDRKPRIAIARSTLVLNGGAESTIVAERVASHSAALRREAPDASGVTTIEVLRSGRGQVLTRIPENGTAELTVLREGGASTAESVSFLAGVGQWSIGSGVTAAIVREVVIDGAAIPPVRGAYLLPGSGVHQVVLPEAQSPWVVSTVDADGQALNGLRLYYDGRMRPDSVQPSAAAIVVDEHTASSEVMLQAERVGGYWFKGPESAWTRCRWSECQVLGNTIVLQQACKILVELVDYPCSGVVSLLSPAGPTAGEQVDEYLIGEGPSLSIDGLAPGRVWARVRVGESQEVAAEMVADLAPGEMHEWRVLCRRPTVPLVKLLVLGTEGVSPSTKLILGPLSESSAIQRELAPRGYTIRANSIEAQWTDVPTGSALVGIGPHCFKVEIPEQEVAEISLELGQSSVRHLLFLDAANGGEVVPDYVLWSWWPQGDFADSHFGPSSSRSGERSALLELLTPPGRIGLVIGLQGEVFTRWVDVGHEPGVHEVPLAPPFKLTFGSRTPLSPAYLSEVGLQRDGTAIPRSEIGYTSSLARPSPERTLRVHSSPPDRVLVPHPTRHGQGVWLSVPSGERAMRVDVDQLFSESE